MLRSFTVLLACALCALASLSQTSVPTREPLTLTHPLQDKNFYLFSLIEQSDAALKALRDDANLATIAKDRAFALHAVVSADHQSAFTYIEPLLWSPSQIESISTSLSRLYASSAAIRTLTNGPLQASGVGPTTATGADLLVSVWRREAEGMNAILSVYGLGVAPAHADIDGLAYSSGDPTYREFLQELVRVSGLSSDAEDLFVAPALRAAITLLEANQRDEAVRFEPMESGENAAALHHLAAIDWSRYRYSVILVPGIGPDSPGFRLSPMGLLHVRAAAAEYRKGVAPFILLSGGYVHPNQTQFSEAIEMKRALMRDYGIPAEAILVDPHARHTTTNLRNAARILYRDGLPIGRPVLIVGDTFQNRYILSDEFAVRCDHELGYRPFRDLKPISAEALEWTPNFIDSLEQDARDPLDP